MINYTKMARRVAADECRRDFFYFVEIFWNVIIKEAPVYNWHIPYLCGELQKLSVPIVERKPKPYDLIINIPPGTTKSTIVTVMWPVWLWIQDASLRIITNSYSGALSIEHAMKSKDIIESGKFRRMFPEIRIRRDKSGKQNYENTATGYRYATSTGATITGFHAHVIINDDPVNPKQAESEQMRTAANEHTKTLSSRKVDKANTPVVTIMQRLHEEDVTGYLLKKKGENIRHICLPAEDSDNVHPAELRKNYVGGLLDPVRLSRKVLDEARTDLGSRGYAGQYDQMPTTAGGNIIKEAWFRHRSLSISSLTRRITRSRRATTTRAASSVPARYVTTSTSPAPRRSTRSFPTSSATCRTSWQRTMPRARARFASSQRPTACRYASSCRRAAL